MARYNIHPRNAAAAASILDKLDDKRLACGAYFDRHENCFCLVGAIASVSPDIEAIKIHQSGFDEAALKQLPVPPTDITEFIRLNDSRFELTPTGRYTYVRSFLQNIVDSNPDAFIDGVPS